MRKENLAPGPSPARRGEKEAIISPLFTQSERNPTKNIPPKSTMSSGVVALQYVDEHKKEQARVLRKNSTEAENILWSYLRNKQIDGFKFRRQQIIEGFIADFFCEKAKLVVEVDGNIHEIEDVQENDRHKENVFTARSLYVLRFKNEQIFDDIENVISEIKQTIYKRLGKN